MGIHVLRPLKENTDARSGKPPASRYTGQLLSDSGRPICIDLTASDDDIDRDDDNREFDPSEDHVERIERKISQLRADARRARQALVAAARGIAQKNDNTRASAEFSDDFYRRMDNHRFWHRANDRWERGVTEPMEEEADSSGGSAEPSDGESIYSTSPRSADESESGEHMDFVVPDTVDEPSDDASDDGGSSDDDGTDFGHTDDESSDDGEYNRFIDESRSAAARHINGLQQNGLGPSTLTATPRDVMEIAGEETVPNVSSMHVDSGRGPSRHANKVGRRLGMGYSRDRDARRWNPPLARYTGTIGEVFDSPAGGIGQPNGTARQLSSGQTSGEVREVRNQGQELRGNGHRYVEPFHTSAQRYTAYFNACTRFDVRPLSYPVFNII